MNNSKILQLEEMKTKRKAQAQDSREELELFEDETVKGERVQMVPADSLESR